MGHNRDIRGDVRGEIREFLTTRRAKITPERAGLPVFGGDRRRVSGLRRDEVALLAGISSQYYTRLERGNATGVSDSVIDGIADALQLDEAERTHLLHLISAAGRTRAPRRLVPQLVRSTVQRVLDSMSGTPAFVLNGRLDILAANQLGCALYSPIYADPVGPPNAARFVFLDTHATVFFRDWNKAANETVALLRAEVLGSRIWMGRCDPWTARHEAEVFGLQVLDVGHQPHPSPLPAEAERQHSSVVPPTEPSESAVRGELGWRVQAGHGSEHQVGKPHLVNTAVCDDHDQPFGTRLQISPHFLGAPPQVVKVLFIGVMDVGQIGNRQSGVLDLLRSRVIEPQSPQLGGHINLSEQRNMVPQLRVLRRKIHPRRALPYRNHMRRPGRVSDCARSAACPQVTAAHNDVDGQLR
jgi:transcriptional regulator with XRE-family HTH domain